MEALFNRLYRNGYVLPGSVLHSISMAGYQLTTDGTAWIKNG